MSAKRSTTIAIVTDQHETLDFEDESGKQVHIERTKAYITLPYCTMPDVVMLRGHHQLGTGTIEIEMFVKKEVINCRLVHDTLSVKAAS